VPPAPKFTPGAGDVVEKMSPMRKRIAEHMILSRRTSAHVHSVFEVNFSRLAQIREARKGEFERAGAKLTYMSFIIKAAVDALRAVPVVNASVDGDTVVLSPGREHRDCGRARLGIDRASDQNQADEKNLLGLSRAVIDLANRARGKQLKPDEVQGGTFTITNPGVFGALFGTPIIISRRSRFSASATSKSARGDRRRDRDPADGVSHAWLRSPRRSTVRCRSFMSHV
jgi:2-oxoglutarate dehydrogenase E2 component (dihydrolipoamide succinyltransferase)